MSNPSSILQDTPLPRGSIQGHALKRQLPSATADVDRSDWATLEAGKVHTVPTPHTSYLVHDADPVCGTKDILLVFENGGELTGPLQYRLAPEHSAGKLLGAARLRQRIKTFAALVVALAWCAGTQALAPRWMMADSYAWIGAGLVMAWFAVVQLKMAGKDLLKGVISLVKTALPDTGLLLVTTDVAGAAELKQAA